MQCRCQRQLIENAWSALKGIAGAFRHLADSGKVLITMPLREAGRAWSEGIVRRFDDWRPVSYNLKSACRLEGSQWRKHTKGILADRRNM